MNPIMSFLRKATGAETRGELRTARRRLTRAQRFINTAIQSGRTGNGSWTGIRSNRDEDAANKESAKSLADVLQRSQDLDINNPDLRGFHRARTSQIVGAHVRFKFAGKPAELGLSPEQALEIGEKINRIRQLHSRAGGFDSTGKNRSEGTQQTRAMLTALINGGCLIHRVWRPENAILPLSIELIPGVRISTPIDRQGDPRISYGVEYADEFRSRVVAYHVRRVARTVGDSFIPVFTWDRLPVEDCAFLELPEQAGMDRSMPLSVACVGRLRARGEFIQSTLDSARAQAGYYVAVEVEKGANPMDRAEDDATETQTDADGNTLGFVDDGPVKRWYLNNGEKAIWNAARLPDPDFVGFNDVIDEGTARGLSSSKSRFTRRVNSSWAGGRLEDQQDDPIIDTNREVFAAAWEHVNVWLLDAIWMSGAIDLPGYSTATRVHWAEFRAQYPGKLHINPQDTMKARASGYALRTTTPQQACEEDGKDLRENLKQFAEAEVLRIAIENEHDLPEGTLSFMLETKTVSTSAGDEIGAEQIVPEDGSDGDAQPGTPAKKPKNGPRPSNGAGAMPPLRIATGGRGSA